MNTAELIIIILLVIVIVLLCILIFKVNKSNNLTKDKTENNKTLDVKNIVESKKYGFDKPEESQFNTIKPGDIVYCLMPLSKAEISKVPKGHRERPYLIVDKGNKFLYGYYSTTHVNEKIPYQEKYTYRRNLVNQKGEIVDSNFTFNETVKIPEKNIMYTLDSLDDYEKEAVEKRLLIKKLRGFSDINRKTLKLNIGDIVLNNAKWYFISDIDKTGIYGYLAYPGDHGSKKGTKVPRQYGPVNYNFAEKVKLENVTINDLIYLSSPTETNNVLKAADDYKRNVKYQKKKANQKKAKEEKKKLAQEINKKYNPNQHKTNKNILNNSETEGMIENDI